MQGSSMHCAGPRSLMLVSTFCPSPHPIPPHWQGMEVQPGGRGNTHLLRGLDVRALAHRRWGDAAQLKAGKQAAEERSQQQRGAAEERWRQQRDAAEALRAEEELVRREELALRCGIAWVAAMVTGRLTARWLAFFRYLFCFSPLAALLRCSCRIAENRLPADTATNRAYSHYWSLSGWVRDGPRYGYNLDVILETVSKPVQLLQRCVGPGRVKPERCGRLLQLQRAAVGAA